MYKLFLEIDKDELTKFAIEKEFHKRPTEIKTFHIKDDMLKYYRKAEKVTFVGDDGIRTEIKNKEIS